ncbi:hypothetical protein ACHAWX_002946 [Stephanocyclus meneghinianus]
MIPNADIVGGACEEVVDILENIPSGDNERRAATNVGTCDNSSGRRGGYRLWIPASFNILSIGERRKHEYSASAAVMSVLAEHASDEEPEERRIGVIDTEDKEVIYNISSTEEQINPLSYTVYFFFFKQ